MYTDVLLPHRAAFPLISFCFLVRFGFGSSTYSLRNAWGMPPVLTISLWTDEDSMPLGRVIMLTGVGYATWACPDAHWDWTVLLLASAPLQLCRKRMDIIFDFLLIFS